MLDLGVGGATDPLGLVSFDLGDDRVGGTHEPQTAASGDDQRCSPILWIGPACDVAEALKVVKDGSDRLLAPPGLPCQLARPDAGLVKVGEHGAMPRADVVEAEFAQSGKQLPLHGEQQSCREHSDIGVPGLPCVASHATTLVQSLDNL